MCEHIEGLSLNESFPPRKTDTMKKQFLTKNIVRLAKKDPCEFKKEVSMEVLREVGNACSSKNTEYKLNAVYKCLNSLEEAKENYEEERFQLVSKVKQAQIEVEEANKFHHQKTEFYKNKYEWQTKGFQNAVLKYESERMNSERLRKEVDCKDEIILRSSNINDNLRKENQFLESELNKIKGNNLEGMNYGDVYSLKKQVSLYSERLETKMEELHCQQVAGLEKELKDKINVIESTINCNLCYRNSNPHVVFPCGHHACRNCSKRLKDCHICRKPITCNYNRIVYM